jgi:hypothetical protein
MNARTKRNNWTALKVVLVVIVGITWPALASGQAEPGPIVATPPATAVQAPSPAPATKQQAPRTSLAGVWQLNRDESDIPQREMQPSNGGGNGPYGGNRLYGGHGPYGDQRRGGFGFPGMGGGGRYGRRQAGPADASNQDRRMMQEVMRPTASLKVEKKDNEFDFTDDRGRKSIFFTDGRQIQKSNDTSEQLFSARWDGTELVSDEKGPRGGKLRRTFELSADGLQLDETISIDNGKANPPLVIRYVYDVAPEQEHP